ncbi:MAG: adenylate kinase, partial [Clostridia bacterium]|nr:adenylate kinase [Clostridia bacterium]
KDITEYGSVIESRLDDTGCSIAGLKEDNKQCLEGFVQAGEQVVLIDDSFERAIEALVED